jgi:DHA2 family multidrug resistance protein
MSSRALPQQSGSGPPASGNPAGQELLPEEEELSPYRWIILLGLVTAAILEILDVTIVNVALPQMAGNLGATTDEIGWVATGYILSNVVVLPMTAWLSTRFGRRRYLVASILIFLAGSFFCGTSRTLPELIFWRIVQGSGGAALLSTAQATIREIFPREQQGMVQAIYAMGVIVAPTVGPTVGGWITDNYSWPWIFFVNLPIGAISVAILLAFLTDTKYSVKSTKIDWLGVGLLASGLGCLQYVLEEGNRDDWFESALILRLTVVSVVSLVCLVAWELSSRNKYPIVNFRVVRNRDLAAALIIILSLGFALYGGNFIFPLFAQNIMGFTPTVTGLLLMPGGIGSGLAALMCGRLLNGHTQLVHPRILIFAGFSLLVYSMWSLSHLTPESGEDVTRLSLLLRGIGLGMIFTPINLAAFSTLRGVEIAQGASMLNLMRQLGGSFGIAILGSYVQTQTAAHRTALVGYIYPQNPALQIRVAELTGALTAKGYSLPAAKQGAMAIVDMTVNRQALTMAYNDGFLIVGITILVVAPLVFLLRRGPAIPGAPAASGRNGRGKSPDTAEPAHAS